MGYNLNSGYGKATAGALHNAWATGGKVFMVAKSTAAGRQILQDIFGGDPDGQVRYQATVDAAINLCTASRGDVILIAPGHTETLADGTSLVPDVAGIAIFGLGKGADRPTFSMSATSSNIPVSGASIVWKNCIVKATINSVTAGITISGASCDIDVETQDTSASVEFVSPIVTTAGADKLTLKWKHIGFLAGSACLRGLDLVGCNTGTIDVDFFGSASTAVVNMRTTTSDNVRVTGKFHNGTTSLSKDVVDSVGTSTWSVSGFDVVLGASFSGSYNAAVAGDDVSAVSSVVGAVADAAVADTIEGAAMSTQSLVSDLKAAIQRIGADNANNTAATTLIADNRDGSVLERTETIIATLRDDVASNYIGIDNANNTASTSSVVANVDGTILERLEALMDPLSGYSPKMGFGVTKVSNLADGSGTDNLFTVTGRVLITSLTGEVTTVIGGAATMKIRDITNSVDLCAATTIDTDAVGTMYALTSISANILNGTGATPVIGSIPNITGASQIDVAIVGDVQAPITLAHVLDAVDTGAVTWRLTYIPLVAGATVTAAA